MSRAEALSNRSSRAIDQAGLRQRARAGRRQCSISWRQLRLVYLALWDSYAACSFGEKGRRKGAGVNWKMAVRPASPRTLNSSSAVYGAAARASLAHVLLFSGFFVLFIGTSFDFGRGNLLAAAMGREPNDPLFHKGVVISVVYEFVMDIAGVALIIGCVNVSSSGGWAWPRKFSRAVQLIVAILFALVAIGLTGVSLSKVCGLFMPKRRCPACPPGRTSLCRCLYMGRCNANISWPNPLSFMVATCVSWRWALLR